MLRLIGVNFKKTFTDKSFYACILMTFALCFTAIISYNPTTGDPENILTVMKNYDKQKLLFDNNFNVFSVFSTGGGSWFAIFIPMIAAFSFVGAFSDERESKFIRYTISRTKKIKYNTGNFISAFFSGEIAVTIGYILFGIVISISFHPLSEYSKDMV